MAAMIGTRGSVAALVLAVLGLAGWTSEPRAQPATPLPAVWPITRPGCCAAARWAADSSGLLFYDLPGAARPAGLWRASLTGDQQHLSTDFGYTAADDGLLVVQRGGTTTLQQLDGQSVQVFETGTAAILPSPDGRWLANLRTTVPGGRDSDSREAVTVVAVGGGEAKALLEVARGDYLTWFPDSRRLALFGWHPDGTQPGLWVVDAESRAATQIVQANFLAAIDVSPSGDWLIYLALLQPEPTDNGLWLVRADGSERRRLPLERAAHWSHTDDAVLAMVPAPGGKELRRLDVTTGSWTTVIGREQADFDVEADDWALAPNGRHVYFRSSRDRALWVIQIVE